METAQPSDSTFIAAILLLWLTLMLIFLA